MRLGLDAEVAGDVPSDLLAPVVGDLGQPSAPPLQVGATFDVGIPGAQPRALGLLLLGGAHGRGLRGGGRISMQAMPTRRTVWGQVLTYSSQYSRHKSRPDPIPS